MSRTPREYNRIFRLKIRRKPESVYPFPGWPTCELRVYTVKSTRVIARLAGCAVRTGQSVKISTVIIIEIDRGRQRIGTVICHSAVVVDVVPDRDGSVGIPTAPVVTLRTINIGIVMDVPGSQVGGCTQAAEARIKLALYDAVMK